MSDQLVRQFKEYVQSSSLNYSYKLVLLRSVLPLADSDGFVSIDAATNEFREFYMGRLNEGLTVDRDGAVINSISSMSLRAIQNLVLDNPFAAYSRAGWMQRQGNRMRLNPELWQQLTLADKEDLWQMADRRLEEYYQHRVATGPGLLRPLIAEVQSSYLDARNQRFSGSVPVAKTITQDIPAAIAASGLAPENQYKVVGSAGQGNWASVPWVAVLDRSVTESIQSGIYVVYLFSSDMNSVYLTLMLGVTEFLRQHTGKAGLELLRQKADSIREQLDLSGFQWRDARIGEERLAKQYEAGLIAYSKYDRDRIPEDNVLLEDLKRMLHLYRQVYRPEPESAPRPAELRTPKEMIEEIHQFIKNKGFQYTYPDLCNFYLSLRSKPFVILAGISGTGKSLLPKLFAKAISAESRIISVRPDWNDGSDLLGYLDLEGRFRPGELTGILEECRGNPNVPYLVVLDEMNLARVEHYMSDLLSKMETRQAVEGRIQTEPLFEGHHFRLEEDRQRYAGINLPDNLYLVGTVNMDETTHPFSKKVLDRANTIEFSTVDLKGYGLASGEAEPVLIRNNQLRGLWVHLSDALTVDPQFVDDVVDKLVEVNRILSQANLHVGYRVRDEVVIYMLHNKQLGLLPEAEAFDYQLLQKILPRIQGSSQPVKRVLVELLRYSGGVDLGTANDDLLARLQEFESGGNMGIYPRSAAKLANMLRRFEEDGFTSYWI